MWLPEKLSGPHMMRGRDNEEIEAGCFTAEAYVGDDY